MSITGIDPASDLAVLDSIIGRVVDKAHQLRLDIICDSEQTLKLLRSEISHLQTLARSGVQLLPPLNYFESPDAAQSQSLVDSARLTLLEIEGDVDEIIANARNGGPQQLFNQQKCQDYYERLNQDRLALSNALSRLQIEEMQRMAKCMEDPEILGFCHQVNDGEGESTHIACLDLGNGSAALETATNDSRPEVDDYNLPRTQNARIWKHWTHLLRGRCVANCGCKCHSINSYTCPSGLRRVIQRLFPRLNGEPTLINQCSRSGCRSNSARRGRITIVIHSVVLKRAVLFSAIVRGFKPKFHVRACRVIDGSSDATRYAQSGDIEGMKVLFQTGIASVYDVGSDGWSYLHESSFHGHMKMVKFLLSQGADPDLAELKLRRASHFSKFRAITARASDNEKGLAKIFQDEQEFREDLQLSPILTTILREYDPLDIEKPTLGDIIHFALEAAKHFPAKNLKAWILEYQGRSPLYHEIIESLEKSSREDRSCTSALSSLLEQADALQGWKPVHWAAFVGRLDDFKLLRENGADLSAITTSGRNVIHQAAETGAVEILEYLLQGYVQAERLDINLPDIWGETPLHIAAAKSAACAKILAEHGANVEARQGEGEIPLHYARYLKGKDRVEALGALLVVGRRQVNTTDKTGRSPIYYFLDTPESVSLLLDHGADVTIADSEGTTITHLVCAQNRPNILDMILRRSTPQVIAVKDHGGDTPLFTSFRNHSVECVKILLNRAAFSSLKDADGCSPVHHAVKMGDPGVLELALTIPGIDIYSKNKLGQDAFDIAAEMKTMDRRIGEILAIAASS